MNQSRLAVRLLSLACMLVIRTSPAEARQARPTDTVAIQSRAQRAVRPPAQLPTIAYRRLVRITPDSARPGDMVRIMVVPQVRSARLAVVTFNGRSAEVTFESGALLARVPVDLGTDTTAYVNVEIEKLTYGPTGKVRLLPQQLRILSVTPNPAKPGDTLDIVLQPPFQFDPGERMQATIGSLRGQVLHADPKQLRLSVVVPPSVRTGIHSVTLSVGSHASEPFEELLVVEPAARFSVVTISIIAFLVVGLIARFVVWRVQRRRRLREKAILEKQAGVGSPEDTATYPVPEIPPELVSACLNDECVVYVGAGLSAAAGFPTWVPFVRGLLEWAAQQQIVDPTLAESLRRALQQGQPGEVADNIVSILAGQEKLLDEYLGTIFIDPKPSIPPSHGLIRKIGFSAVLTTNFDNLLERALATTETDVLTPVDATQLIDALSKRRFFLLKLYGLLNRPGTVLVCPEQYLDAMARNAPFNQFMETIFFSRTLLFVGASLEGIEDYLKGITFREHRGKPHYALVNAQGTAWQAKAGSLNRRYGIQVLPYTATDGFPEVPVFLSTLAERVNAGRAKAAPAVNARRSTQGTPLKKVRLENIGPFPTLQLELDPHLNIFLGDNGLGKSTILKAIAVGLCGKDAQPYAGRLIKTGAAPDGKPITEAKIGLETERSQYLTQLLRGDPEAQLTVRPGRPLEAEGWLAVGFPPLRNVSWKRSEAPKPPGKSIPTANDLMPIIKGDPDPRMDNLKQWLVDLDYMIARATKDGAESERYRALRDEFFKIIDRMTPGVRVRFKAVNPVTKQVTVLTDDGEVPIESVSQGTTSLISWIGVLLQRLYEVYGDESNPLDRYALVLIDEIDAHMHPEWQQKLVHTLGEIFPNIQFVATTHSPLIVAGLPTKQIVRLRRNADGQVERVVIEEGTTMGRTDQVLTSQLFDLHSTVDPITEQYIPEYQRLLGVSERSEKDTKRLRELEAILQFRIPMTAETLPERRAQELVHAILRVQSGGDFPEAEKVLEEKAASLIKAVTTSGGQPR